MKRGIEILTMWLIVIVIVETFFPRVYPRFGMDLVDMLAVLGFPLGAFAYGRHSGRLTPVICYGLIGGVFCVFGPFLLFDNSFGRVEPITFSRELLIFSIPVLMALVCSAVCIFRRYLERDDDGHDADKPPGEGTA